MKKFKIDISVKPEVAHPTPECNNPSKWKCYDGEATEVEVLEFLHHLVRMIKPNLCIETGAYLGIGTLHIADAIKENGQGKLVSCELDEQRIPLALQLLTDNGVDSLVEIKNCTGEENISAFADNSIDFAFLDSSLTGRIRELILLIPKLSKGGVVAIHDTNTYHASNGGPREGVQSVAKEMGMQIIQFDTPRGLTVLKKL